MTLKLETSCYLILDAHPDVPPRKLEVGQTLLVYHRGHLVNRLDSNTPCLHIEPREKNLGGAFVEAQYSPGPKFTRTNTRNTYLSKDGEYTSASGIRIVGG